MYRIRNDSNSIERVNTVTFSSLGYSERGNLQEWIAQNPTVLGEELLIIQKEFSGFSDTNERLDLLALDKDGNLAIIENKLDDSGRDVVWQSLKYASYCSQLTKENIIELYQTYLDRNGAQADAEQSILDFLEASDIDEIQLNIGNSQRIIMVAANFRKEVTSTALWLLSFGLKVQCFKVTPYAIGDDTFVSFDQIIPISDASDYMITMAKKTQGETDSKLRDDSTRRIQQRFWTQFIEKASERLGLYENIGPPDRGHIIGTTGTTGVEYNCVITSKGARVEIYIQRSTMEENKLIFDEFAKDRQEIEAKFGEVLTWERLDHRSACRIRYDIASADYRNEDDWGDMTEFMIKAMRRLKDATGDPLVRARQVLLAYLHKE